MVFSGSVVLMGVVIGLGQEAAARSAVSWLWIERDELLPTMVRARIMRGSRFVWIQGKVMLIRYNQALSERHGA